CGGLRRPGAIGSRRPGAIGSRSQVARKLIQDECAPAPKLIRGSLVQLVAKLQEAYSKMLLTM
ncbi:hypothetical protein, partial [Siminovitchia terrae]|uniref:hypothetical protein n=1 Tax=Siminovitchia terrae TaxID=1914933 RepID=UPI0028A89E85